MSATSDAWATAEALRIQHSIAGERKPAGIAIIAVRGTPACGDMGRNGHEENLLAPAKLLSRTGIELHRNRSRRRCDLSRAGADRGVSDHGSARVEARCRRVMCARLNRCSSIRWQILVSQAAGVARLTGVWTWRAGEDCGHRGASEPLGLDAWLGAECVDGFAVFRYIVPCGLTKPVTSMAAAGCRCGPEDVKSALARHFGRLFEFEMQRP